MLDVEFSVRWRKRVQGHGDSVTYLFLKSTLLALFLLTVPFLDYCILYNKGSLKLFHICEDVSLHHPLILDA